MIAEENFENKVEIDPINPLLKPISVYQIREVLFGPCITAFKIVNSAKMGVGENSLVEVEKGVISKVEQPKSVDGVVNPQYQIPITNYRQIHLLGQG